MESSEKVKEIMDGAYLLWDENILTSEKIIELSKFLVEALNKQIPKAIEYDEDDLNICPECGLHVHTDDYYCKHCGQAIYYNINKE